jgi:uncharacterized membrane protein
LHLVVFKFPDERLTRPIAQELNAVRKSGLIRPVDMAYVSKDPNGELKTHEVSDLPQAQKAEYGIILNGLMGLRKAYTTGGNVDEIAAAMSQTPGEFKLSNEQIQKLGEDLPNGGAAMLILFEHMWSIKFKEACLTANGQLVTQGVLSPETLAFAGMTLDDAMVASQKIQDDASAAAAVSEAAAAQKLTDADAAVAAKYAAAQRILEDENAAMAARQAEAQKVLDEAAASVAASEAAAAQKLTDADAAVAAKFAAAQRMLEDAEAGVAARKAEAQKLFDEAEAGLAAKKVEAQRILDEADAQAAAKVEQGKAAADAALAAGVRAAAEEMKKAEEIRKQAEREAAERLDESKKGPGSIF